MRGASLLSSVLIPRSEISSSVKPVILEFVMLRVALVALNHPGNFNTAPFFIVNRLLAPETVKASFRNGAMESVWVVTVELSRTSSPPAEGSDRWACCATIWDTFLNTLPRGYPSRYGLFLRRVARASTEMPSFIYGPL